ncbi:MAG: CHAT domain-containing tetratricopeptide repeat protein [Bacteroidota bacterium]
MTTIYQLKYLLFSLCFLCGQMIPFAVHTQSNSLVEDTTLAASYLNKSKTFSDSANYEKAIELAQKAQDIYEAYDLWEKALNCEIQVVRQYDALGDQDGRLVRINSLIQKIKVHLHANHLLMGDAMQQKAEVMLALEEMDSTRIYVDEAIRLSKQHQNWETYCWSLMIKAVYSYYNDLYDNMSAELTEAYAKAEEHLQWPNGIFESIFQLEGVLFEMNGDYEQALASSEQALHLLLANENPTSLDSSFIVTSYNNMGAIYFDKGDIGQADAHYKIALQMLKATDAAPDELITLQNNLALCAQKNGDYEQAAYYLAQSRKLLTEIPTATNHEDWLSTHGILAGLYVDQIKNDQAQQLIEKIIPVFLQYDEDPSWVRVSYGSSMAKTDHLEPALTQFKLARIGYEHRYGKRHPTVAETYRNIGDVLMMLGSKEQALANYQQALIALSTTFESSDYFENPSIEEVNDLTELVNVLERKASLIQQQTTTQAQKEQTRSTYLLAEQAIDKLYQQYESEEGKLLLRNSAKPLYEKHIRLLYSLYATDKNPAYLEKIFKLMEVSKSYLLLEGVRKAEQQLLAMDSEFEGDQQFVDLLQQEKQLKVDITFYDRKLFEYRQEDAAENAQKIATTEKILARLYEEKRQMEAQLQAQYPSYFSINYTKQVATLEEVQAMLVASDNRVFIEYFVGEADLFILRITDEDVLIHQVSIDENYEQLIQQFQAFQAFDPFAQAQAEQNFQQYTKVAYQLYNLVVAPVLADLPARFEELLIVPDDQLGYIAFDALLSAAPTHSEVSYDARKLSYLINDWVIGYAYSATLFLEHQDRSPTGVDLDNYLGFAPIFADQPILEDAIKGCEGDEPLGMLQYSTESIKLARQQYGGQVYLGQQATKEAFLAQAAKYQILHLSTHACVDDSDPKFNKIFFADQFLSTYEVYQLQLNASLVLLSACETGFGKLAKGEGIMSLARGFFYAGSPSLVTSLWKANDFATAEIMKSFHQYLKEGQEKNRALRNAKIDYLRKKPMRELPPFFWATFVLVGNDQPIMVSNDSYAPTIPYLILFVIVVCFGLYFYSKINKRKTHERNEMGVLD